MGLELDPATFLIKGEDTGSCHGPRSSKSSGLYSLSGRRKGVGIDFGDLAEQYGLQEIDFSSEGHTQERTRGRKAPYRARVGSGDVSLLYVSRRLKRGYSKEGVIRRVLQSIWHQVSWSDQVL